MSFFDNIKEKGQDFINDIKENTDGIKDFIEDPSKIVEKGLNFVSQDGKCSMTVKSDIILGYL